MVEVVTMRKGVDDKFSQAVGRQLIAVTTEHPLEMASHVDLRKDVIMSLFNQLANRVRKFAAINKHGFGVALEHATLDANALRGVTRQQGVGV